MNHIEYMKLAMEMAEKGMGTTSPNPMVGAVIVKNGKVIGTGYHKFAGKNHAEINAIENANKEIKGATMYVTLEPCCHYGKTPPCVDSIIKSGIKKVFVAMKDPNPLVNGKGIKKLRDSGIKVEIGVLQQESKKLNEVYIKYITQKIPYVIMKYAMTLDGKLATFSGDSKWLSNEQSRNIVQKLRSNVDAILVGANTVIRDNPWLTVRDVSCYKKPYRIVLDSHCKIPFSSNVFDGTARTIIATTSSAPLAKIKKAENIGMEIIVVKSKNGMVSIRKLFEELAKREITSVLVEGGSEVNASVLENGLVDKLIVFIVPKILGGRTAITPIAGKGIKFVKDAIKLKNIEIQKIDDDIMITGYVN